MLKSELNSIFCNRMKNKSNIRKYNKYEDIRDISKTE